VVRVDGSVATHLDASVFEGQFVEIMVPQIKEIDNSPENIPLNIIYEDEFLIVVNKPPGMVVHPAPGSPNKTLVNALLHHCGETLSGIGGNKRPGIVHRIDKGTSGLLVSAKSDFAHQLLAKQFESHLVERSYHALCFGVPDANDPRLRGIKGVSFEQGNILKITTNLARHRTNRQKQAVVFGKGRHAVTRVKVREKYGPLSSLALIECRLETGRTHQIRVHLAHAGHGLVGDPLYGGRRKIPSKSFPEQIVNGILSFPRQALHAASLGFIHPKTKETLNFEAPLPDDMSDIIKMLS
tara:strand:+ start:383 stop:1273 length:891 start_codon:yes stop_codon:yes gene_type:complete